MNLSERMNTISVGDVLDFLKSLPDNSVPMFLFSPPYNLGMTTGGGWPGGKKRPFASPGKWTGGALADGYTDHDDAMTYEEYKAWQHEILNECWRCLTDRGAIYYQHKPRVQDGIVQMPLDLVPGLPIRQVVIWARAGGVNFSPSFYCPTHEYVIIIAKPDFRLRDKAASGAGDVWYIPQDTHNPHPAPFPVKLATMALETTRPDFVVDPFMGSGSTAVGAKSLGINFIGNDKSQKYVDMALERVGNTPEPFILQTSEQIGMSL